MRDSQVTKMSNYIIDQSLAATYSKGGGGGGHHDDGYDSSGFGSYGGYGGGGGGCVVSPEQWLGAVLIAGAGVAIGKDHLNSPQAKAESFLLPPSHPTNK